MTQDEIMAMWNSVIKYAPSEVRITEFAKLVAAKEREACAKVCETHGVHVALNVWNGGPDWYKHGKECAAAIRARGEA